MTCKELIEFLGDYLDESLDPKVRDEFRKHLEACPPCALYVESYNTTRELGHGAFCHEGDAIPDSMPEDLVSAVLEAIKKA